MKLSIKIGLIFCLGVVILTLTVWQINHRNPASALQTTLKSAYFGQIVVASPGDEVNGLSVVFVDLQHFNAEDLARRIAATGSVVAVIDSRTALQALSGSGQHCLDSKLINEPVQLLDKWIKVDNGKHIIAGIGDGALLAFVASQDNSIVNTDFLSVDFSSTLPKSIEVCPPLVVDLNTHSLQAQVNPQSSNHWRAAWTDQPESKTGIFVRSIANAETVIEAYDTPLDLVMLHEISKLLGVSDGLAPTMPIIEVAASQPNPTLTLFYSGDGGWRDLDRAVAEEMAKAGFPVTGVDVLRYFWEHKTPEQAATDLSATMAYYRKTQGIKSFVLAGYSFGADILPAMFNRLSVADQNDVKLLVLLAVADQANFEIHVSGWLGQHSGEQALAPELARITTTKIMCVYGKDEQDHRGCKGLENSNAELLELPGGHHFDEDYPKLAQRIIDTYHRHALN
jgi:type IV secretory pathway VirJ component